MANETTNTAFYRWLLTQCRRAGYDIDALETHTEIIMITSVALSEGLPPETTGHIADALGVTSRELTRAYLGEMRQKTVSEILAHPDLAALDARLNDIAGTG
ncbi:MULTISPECIES: hypothetical protein [unclassified Streptomyces]|uniref:hypothetical protein n=1 Tax=unclassified Streptomyces TaxID=2593676 RepID=UPI0013B94A79|nr:MULTISPECIES: hypothetical protein [unclassified Streptomyces]NDZ87501.1 hypothetical protein [Streptomyces sp. SID10115]NEA06033.1 hypothetical protein [Streptomyces sp. SID10116]NEB48470.1 hypothetical protein [Streptomyces sp. SID339]